MDAARVPAWDAPGWQRSVVAWAAGRLAGFGMAVTGPAEVTRQWSASCMLRVPTTHGDAHVKSVPSCFAREPGVIRGLARRWPDSVPEVIGVREEVGGGATFLMRGFSGPHLSAPGGVSPTTGSLGPWVATVRCLARMQVDVVGREAELHAWGAEPRPVTGLPAALLEILAVEPVTDAPAETSLGAEEARRLAAIVPKLGTWVDRLAAGPVPAATLVHGDVHGGNVVLVPDGRDGHPLLFDWTDAAISHPFLDLPMLFEGEGAPRGDAAAAVLAAYLDVWVEAGCGDLAALHAAYGLAAAVAPLYHAASYAAIYAALGEPAREDMGHMLPRLCRRLLRDASQSSRGQGRNSDASAPL